MKKEQSVVVKIAIGLALAMILISCASTPKTSGFLGEYYNNLQPGPEGGAKMRWLKPGVDLAKYDKVMIDSVVYFFAEDSEYKGIDPEVMMELTTLFEQEIKDAYKDKYPIVTKPGPGVARFKVALTGLKQSRPVVSGVTTAIPVGLAVSTVKRGTTGAWTGSGATSAELIVMDSVSNEVVAVVQDEQAAGFINRFTKYGSARDAFKYWAGKLRAFTDNTHAMKQ